MDVSPQTEKENSRKLLARFAQLNVVYNIAVILWGAYVRATGSGAGCGGHWPLCNGKIIPTSVQTQTMIEFVHRVTSGTALVLTTLLVIWCWRKTVKGDWARYSSACALVLLLNEAMLGALLVLLDHVGMDRSAGRVVFLCLHFGNTLLLLGSLALTAKWLSGPNSCFGFVGTRREHVAIGLGLASVIAVGITGSLAALGDTLFPAISLRVALKQDFSASSDALLRLRVFHPVAAVVGAIYVLWVVQKLALAKYRQPRLLLLISGALATQVVLGVLNVVFLAPVGLQIAHLLFADLLWILLVLASAELNLQQAA